MDAYEHTAQCSLVCSICISVCHTLLFAVDFALAVCIQVHRGNLGQA